MNHVKQLDVRVGDVTVLPPVFLYDVNRPVDGAWRSPHAPTPHTETLLHGVTEPTVGRHTHLSLVHSLCELLTLLFSAVPPRFLYRLLSACGRSHPCETWPSSSSVRLSTASQEFSLPLAGVGALTPAHNHHGIHSTQRLKFSFKFGQTPALDTSRFLKTTTTTFEHPHQIAINRSTCTSCPCSGSKCGPAGLPFRPLPPSLPPPFFCFCSSFLLSPTATPPSITERRGLSSLLTNYSSLSLSLV